MKIIRGYKKREYEQYRVAAFHIYYMAQVMGKDANHFHPDRIQPPYDQRALTAEQKKKLDTYRQMKAIKERNAGMKERIKEAENA